MSININAVNKCHARVFLGKGAVSLLSLIDDRSRQQPENDNDYEDGLAEITGTEEEFMG